MASWRNQRPGVVDAINDDHGKAKMSAPAKPAELGDGEHLKVLGYEDSFNRSMSLWANFALGFTYLSPLVGVYSLFALALTVGGPPSIWWIVIVGAGQLLVSLVFGEVVSQYPIHGGIYPWARRLWGRRYAWMAAWVYIWAMIVTITAVAEYGSGFTASLFGIEHTADTTLWITLGLLLVALAINLSGTKWLARVARIGLAAELVGVIGLGLYLLVFQRKQEFGVFFDTMGVEGDGSYLTAFVGAALAGLFLFYGFEACGDVAEEVENPARRIPKAMIMTILVGGVSALFSFGGYVLAAPDLGAIVAGEDVDPIPAILESTLGPVGAKLFLVVAVTAFLSCVLSLQAAASRALIAVLVWLNADLLYPVTAFAVLGIYVAFQMVVLASLRQRFRGWKPAGAFSLGRWGIIVNVAALAYGVFAMVLLATPGTSGDVVTDWIVLIGLGVVLVSGLAYLLLARPDRKSDAPADDALEVADRLRAHREERAAAPTAVN
ncbi:MAG: amino acid permease [Agromyces sp.]|nr:amino acid permease [Agromyces sp.]